MFTLILMEPNLVTHEPEVLPEIHFADLAVRKKMFLRELFQEAFVCLFLKIGE